MKNNNPYTRFTAGEFCILAACALMPLLAFIVITYKSIIQ